MEFLEIFRKNEKGTKIIWISSNETNVSNASKTLNYLTFSSFKQLFWRKFGSKESPFFSFDRGSVFTLHVIMLLLTHRWNETVSVCVRACVIERE